MLIATAGHVDHGKTVLVHALTGVDTDRLPEEKRRGLTIDLGFAYRDIGGGRILGFVDVPGHERFIHNMLAGISAIDFILLIVAADEGPKPQTIEHVAILDLLGLERGAVVLTKADRVSSERTAQVASEMEALLAETSLAGFPIYPLSAVTGLGLKALDEHLIETALKLPRRPATGNFRLAIDRSFTITGAGLIVTGAVFSGEAKVGDHLSLMPRNLKVRVRGIHAQGKESQIGRAGERCAMNLAGINLKASDVHRGDWLSGADNPNSTLRFDARLRVLPSEQRPLVHWTPVHVHVGAASLNGRVAVLERSSRKIPPGGRALVQIILDRPTCVVHGDRFILRDQSAQRTVAGGTVLDSFPPTRGRGKPSRIGFLKAMEIRSHADSLYRLLDNVEGGIDINHFCSVRNLTDKEKSELLDQVPMSEIKVSGTRTGVLTERWQSLRSRLLQGLAEFHKKFPAKPGLTESALRRAAASETPRELVEAAVRDLNEENLLVRDGEYLRLTNHRRGLSPEETELWQRVKALVLEKDLSPPSIAELAEELGMDMPVLKAFLNRAAKRGDLVRVAENRYFHPKAVDRLIEIAEYLASESPGGQFDAKTYRDQSGIGRNLTISVLEYFDAVGLTRRIGNQRRLIRSSSEIHAGARPRSMR